MIMIKRQRLLLTLITMFNKYMKQIDDKDFYIKLYYIEQQMYQIDEEVINNAMMYYDVQNNYYKNVVGRNANVIKEKKENDMINLLINWDNRYAKLESRLDKLMYDWVKSHKDKDKLKIEIQNDFCYDLDSNTAIKDMEKLLGINAPYQETNDRDSDIDDDGWYR